MDYLAFRELAGYSFSNYPFLIIGQKAGCKILCVMKKQNHTTLADFTSEKIDEKKLDHIKGGIVIEEEIIG